MVPADFGRHHISIVEDDAASRNALKLFLSAQKYRIGAFATAEAWLEQMPASSTDCLLLNMQLPGINGIDLLRQLYQQGGPPVIVFTGNEDVRLAVEAMKLGALDFLVQPLNNRQLLKTIRAALSSESQLRARRLYLQLSHREREVAQLIVKGLTTREIAQRVNVSARTIETHRAHILLKLNAANVADLVRTVMLAQTDR